MAIFTVHQPPEHWPEARRGPERFVFVRDGFHLWAFLFAPFWMLYRRLYLVFIGYAVVAVALNIALLFAHASGRATFLAHALLALLVGLEAGTLRRWTLQRRGWREVGIVSAEDREVAERRFFARWSAEHEGQPSAAVSAPGPMRRPASASDVIGLFPEPGAPR
ncbi:MAG: DUF2628 domain-containing protein [Variibacter sp.]|nr:DUF2628 domain-containing protein [Variibacter sp.]